MIFYFFLYLLIGNWCSICFFFSSRRRHTRSKRDWSSDVCSSDLANQGGYTVGALVQCNCGSRRQLRIGGLPVGEEIAAQPPRAALDPPYREDVGSIIIV